MGRKPKTWTPSPIRQALASVAHEMDLSTVSEEDIRAAEKRWQEEHGKDGQEAGSAKKARRRRSRRTQGTPGEGQGEAGPTR